MDIELFIYLEKNSNNLLTTIDKNFILPIIKKCINNKQKIIKQDIYDRDNRQILNFGHTIGHALESYFNF